MRMGGSGGDKREKRGGGRVGINQQVVQLIDIEQCERWLRS